jgi:hypothetical protein
MRTGHGYLIRGRSDSGHGGVVAAAAGVGTKALGEAVTTWESRGMLEGTFLLVEVANLQVMAVVATVAGGGCYGGRRLPRGRRRSRRRRPRWRSSLRRPIRGARSPFRRVKHRIPHF